MMEILIVWCRISLDRRMSQPMSVAASLPPAVLKSLAIEVLSKTEPISRLAAQHQVSSSSSTGALANEALMLPSAATDEREVLSTCPSPRPGYFN